METRLSLSQSQWIMSLVSSRHLALLHVSDNRTRWCLAPVNVMMSSFPFRVRVYFFQDQCTDYFLKLESSPSSNISGWNPRLSFLQYVPSSLVYLVVGILQVFLNELHNHLPSLWCLQLSLPHGAFAIYLSFVLFTYEDIKISCSAIILDPNHFNLISKKGLFGKELFE